MHRPEDLRRCEKCHHGKWVNEQCPNCSATRNGESAYLLDRTPPSKPAPVVKRKIDLTLDDKPTLTPRVAPTFLKLGKIPKYTLNSERVEDAIFRRIRAELPDDKAREATKALMEGHSAHYMKQTGLYGYKKSRDIQKLFGML